MSELTVGTISGLAANNYVVDVAAGSQITQPGMVLQVVESKTSTTTATSSTTYVDTSLSGTITPTSSSSKILIVCGAATLLTSGSANYAQLTIFRGDSATGTDLGLATMAESYESAASTVTSNATMTIVDSPATSSAVTYTLAVRSRYNTSSAQVKNHQNMILMEIAQ